MRIYKDNDTFVLDGEHSIQFVDEASTKTRACFTIDIPEGDMTLFRIENFHVIMRRDSDREPFMQRLRTAWRYLWQYNPTWWKGMMNEAIPYTISNKKP